jgi:tetratricopeptide (TPR) repeat protein
VAARDVVRPLRGSAANEHSRAADEAARQPQTGGVGAASGPAAWSWSALWQIPAIVASVCAIAVGLWIGSRPAARDLDGSLAAAEQLVADADLEGARSLLDMAVQPRLDGATDAQRARFHAVAADWIWERRTAAPVDEGGWWGRVASHFGDAASLGARLTPQQVERWGLALVGAGDLEGARIRMRELEGLAAATDAPADVRAGRNRLLRRIVERSLMAGGLGEPALLALLEEYRSDPLVDPADQLWAVERQAELRLDAGRAREAVDQLMVQLRRLEERLPDDPALSPALLYTLLGRGYLDLGNGPYARYHAERALDHFRREDPARAEALLLLGRVAVMEGRWQEAAELFDEVVRNYAGTPAHGGGLLGRAEVASVLGDHDRSAADYRELIERLGRDRRHQPRGLTVSGLVSSLVDRHDAALPMGELRAALRYAMLAEQALVGGPAPAGLLHRLASTSRQIAEDLSARSAAAPGGAPAGEGMDPALRAEASGLFRRAGDYFVRHVRALAGDPAYDQEWSRSLWLAADSYDLGGWRDLAVAHFREYVAGRPDGDSLRTDAMFRLAQLLHAQGDCEGAASLYRQIIQDHPRSIVATRSHVPLARCLIDLARPQEAQQQLRQVVAGEAHLLPDAADYRDALVELGTLHYRGGDYVAAIELLEEAAGRYVDDPRIGAIRFHLAESYRRRARELATEAEDPARSTADAGHLEGTRREHLLRAAELFAAVEAGGAADSGDPDHQERDRFAGLYRADCAFELGRYDQALELYDRAASRAARHLSSLTALIQMVNCYSRMGDADGARRAHQRALVRLRELPDEAFQDADAVLDRDAWERWLQNMPLSVQVAAPTS